MEVALVQTPPSDSSPALSATNVVSQLKRIRFLSAGEALLRLNTLSETSRILWLYRKYFPREYARSTASALVPVTPDGDCGYSEREKEFLELVDKRLFPMPDLFFDETRFDMIPIYPQGVDWDEELEYLRLSLRAGMELLQEEESPFWEQWLPANLRPKPGEHDWKKFEQVCRRVGGSATRLPLLIDLVSHNTGTLWLDAYWESGVEGFTWSEEDVQLLAKEWRAAQRFMNKVDPLLDRIEKHPRYWLTRLVKLWNASIKTGERKN